MSEVAAIRTLSRLYDQVVNLGHKAYLPLTTKPSRMTTLKSVVTLRIFVPTQKFAKLTEKLELLKLCNNN